MCVGTVFARSLGLEVADIQEIGGPQDLNSAPGMHRNQVPHIAGNNDIRLAGGSQFQIFVVVRIDALSDTFSGLDPFRCEDRDVGDTPPTFHETNRSNFGRKMTSLYSFSTAWERISRLGGVTA